MNKYEAMVLFKESLKDPELKKNIEELTSKITEFGGKIMDTDNWGLKDLAYSINGSTKAYYFVLTFEMESDKVNHLSSYLNKQEEAVLRNMITRI